MSRICENGIIRDMTPEEQEQYDNDCANDTPVITDDDLLDALAAALGVEI